MATDRQLKNLLETAQSKSLELSLMRLAGPREFRTSVMAVANGDVLEDESLDLLLSEKPRRVRVLLSDPDGPAFLRRLDNECASTWKVWRVRRHVHRFAQGLLNFGDRHSDSLELSVGLHQEELIWNIGIAGDDEALVTPYGTGTGHDSSAETFEFSRDEAADMLESFRLYFDSVCHKPGTKWISTGTFSPGYPNWPTLHKGNGILISRGRDDREEYEPNVDPEEICKVFSSRSGFEAECKSYEGGHSFGRKSEHFRPGRMTRILVDEHRGESLCIERVNGHSLFDIATRLPVDRFDEVVIEFVRHSYHALREFQQVRGSSESKFPQYPYADKLVDALEAVRPHLPSVNDRTWSNAIDDARRLGKELEDAGSEPFRDAHLKNRLWRFDGTLEELARHVAMTPVKDLGSELSENVVDIDFETSGARVTRFDDLFHILCFQPSSWIGPTNHLDKELAEVVSGIREEPLFWRTGLARSLREHCRRSWYAHIMPNSHAQRYGSESRDYFLELAGLCSRRSGGYPVLGTLVSHLLSASPAGSGSSDGVHSARHKIWVLDTNKAGDSLEAAQSRFVQMAKYESSTTGFGHWVGSDRVSLALVFTDIVGSTALNNDKGDAGMHEIRCNHFDRARTLIAECNGREIKTMGDSFMVAFCNTGDALQFSRKLFKQTGHEDVRIRAGVHFGPMDVWDHDVFGITVNMAARVVGAIKDDEVWLSDEAKADLESRRESELQQVAFESVSNVRLRGFPTPVTLWKLENP